MRFCKKNDKKMTVDIHHADSHTTMNNQLFY